MAFDYKKEYREFYLPPRAPGLVEVPEMRFVAVRGRGDPNAPDGQYQRAMRLIYGIAFTVKMSRLGDHRIAGYFDYVVPPLEGLWRQEGEGRVGLARKETLNWVSMLRLPEFVTRDEFDWARAEFARKKKLDAAQAEYFVYAEGMCVQCLHVGPYDDEPLTLAAMERFAGENGWRVEITSARAHHEIYLGDPRRCAPERLKTVLRLPVAPA